MSTATKRAYDAERYQTRKANREIPKDAIERLTAVELAYIAGIVDGEGSIFATTTGPRSRRTISPVVCVVMTHRPVIEWLKARLDAGKIQDHNGSIRSRKKRASFFGNVKPAWRVQVTGRRAQLLCAALLPYLLVKKEQAALVVAFPIEGRRGRGVKLDPEIATAREQARQSLSALNRPRSTHQP